MNGLPGNITQGILGLFIGDKMYRIILSKEDMLQPETVKKWIINNDKAVKRGTLQHEIFEGSSAEAFIDGDVISIKVNCSKDAKSYSDDIHYALMVSLEVAENIDLPIYQEIKDRIAIPIPINQSANI